MSPEIPRLTVFRVDKRSDNIIHFNIGWLYHRGPFVTWIYCRNVSQTCMQREIRGNWCPYSYYEEPYRSWLRHYATSRNVKGSTSDEVIGFLNWLNPSSCIMALEVVSASNRNGYRNLPGGKGRPAGKADNLTAIYESWLSRNCGSLDVSQFYELPRPARGIVLPPFLYFNYRVQLFVLVCCLFNDALNNSEYVTSKYWMVVNCELKRTENDAVET
jgi:hypothetical protein